MTNYFKYTTSQETAALKKGNFFIGTGDVKKSPTSTTGFWNGYNNPRGWYTIYLNKASNGPAIFTVSSDAELISLTNRIAGASYTTLNQCFNYFRGEVDKVLYNIDYPPISADGLVVNLDANFVSSYPRNGSTWFDVGVSGSNPAALVNSPTFATGAITTNGTNSYILPAIVTNGFEYGLQWDLNWSMEFWMRTDWSLGPHTYKYLYSGYYGIPFVVQPGIVLLNANTPSSAYFSIGVGGETTGVDVTSTWAGSALNGLWNQFVFVSNGTNMRIYHNGVLRSTTTTNWATGLGRRICVQGLEIDSNGKILVAGGFYTYQGTVIGYGLTRLNTDGTRDTGFSPPAFGYKLNKIALAGTDIYVAGHFRYANPNPSTLNLEGVMELNSSGSRTAYMRNGNHDQADINMVKIGPLNGKVYFSTASNVGVTYRFSRVNADLTTDATYTHRTINNLVYGFDIDTAGNIFLCGAFTSYNSVTTQGMAKLDADGNLDTSFNLASGFTGSVFVAKAMSDGKVYAGGAFTAFKGSAINRIIRLNSDGSRDTVFEPGSGLNSTCLVIEVDNNGKIYLGGDFTAYNGGSASRIIRLNTDGTVDTNFGFGTGFNDRVTSIKVDSFNNIYVGGWFTSYNGTPANGIIKLDQNGNPDASFNYGTGFTKVNARPISTTPVMNASPTIGGYIIGFTQLQTEAFRIYNKELSATEVLTNWAAVNLVPISQGTDLLFSVDSTRASSYPRGSFMNGAAYDPVDGSISLDGTDDYIDMTAYREYMFACTTAKSLGSVTGAQTLNVWFKIASDAAAAGIVLSFTDSTTGNYCVIGVGSFTSSYPDESIGIVITDGITGLNVTAWIRKDHTFLYDNQWHNFVYTTDSTGNKFYLDGVLENVSYQTGNSSINAVFNAYNVNKTNVAFLLGARNIGSGPATFTKSKSGHLSVWKRALSTSEVTTLYNYQKSAFGL